MLPDTPFPLASFIKLFKEGICMSNIFSNHIVKSKWQLITSQDHDRSWPMDKLVQARHKVKLSCNPNRSADVSVGWHWHQTFCQKAQLAFWQNPHGNAILSCCKLSEMFCICKRLCSPPLSQVLLSCVLYMTYSLSYVLQVMPVLCYSHTADLPTLCFPHSLCRGHRTAGC